MKEPIYFIVPGKPVGKARPRYSRRSKAFYTPPETASFENLIKLSFSGKYPDFSAFEGPVAVEVTVLMLMPKSFSKKRRLKAFGGRILPTNRPEIDNIVKSILDALEGLAYRRDSQVVELKARKYYSSESKTVIFLRELFFMEGEKG